MYQESKSINNNWMKDSIYTFKIENKKEEPSQNVFLVLKNNEQYKYNNIYFFLTLVKPDGSENIDTVQYRLAKSNGDWTGKGMGNVKENLLLYREKQDFSDSGTYIIKVQHGMRSDNLIGLENIGLIVQKSESNE